MAERISYVVGDATRPRGEGKKIVSHICNNIGVWGRGFVLAISGRWPEPEIMYRDWHRRGKTVEGKPFKLGQVQFVEVVDGEIIIANMIGQRGIRSSRNPIPIDYTAVGDCLSTVANGAQVLSASVHMPRIGAGLAGGDWNRIEGIIQERLTDRGVPVVVYNLPGR
jgi:O-acetyl-ADP-ribose deacetylase (regulator of RNase III)